jgi:cyclomaltodextrinase
MPPDVFYPPSSAPDWVQDAIFYQIFPERFANGDPGNDPPDVAPWGAPPTRQNFFGGDLQGILDRLPYLEDLGVTALYLTPIFKGRTNHKYDTSDYFQVDPAFGDLPLLRRLVEAAHQRGLRIILDAVFNHCGDGFWAFEDLARCGESSAYRDWFFPSAFPLSADPLNYQTCGGASFLPKLNLHNPQVRQHLLGAAVYWLEAAGIDGWRLDVPWKAPLDFWREFRRVVKAANPQAYIVAEAWRDVLPWLQGDTSDAVMNYPLRDYLLDYCARDAMDAEDLDYFIRRQHTEYGPAAASQLTLLGSHDTPRLLTLCGGDLRRLILAITLQFTLPGVPMVYYGDEVGLPGDNDPDCRRCMPWNVSQWEPRIHQAHRRLIRARRQHPALRRGAFTSLLTFNAVYAYARHTPDDQVLVVLNPRQALPEVALPLGPLGRLAQPSNIAWEDLFTGKIYLSKDGVLQIGALLDRQALVLVPARG